MSPKPKQPAAKIMEETIGDMAKQLKTLTSTIQGNNQRMDSLESLIRGLSAENKDLKNEIVARDEEILYLKTRINDMDQRHRTWSTRIFNVPLSKEEESDNFSVMRAVYEKALLPILRGAVDNQLLPDVPTCEQVLETAHVLPGPEGKDKPIIARFFNRNIRAIIFRGKKEHAPRLPAEKQATRNSPARPGKFMFPIYEDLTSVNYSKLRELNASEKTTACWTTNGLIRFKLVGDETVHRVKSSQVFDTAISILNFK